MRVELLVGRARERFGDDAVAVLVLRSIAFLSPALMVPIGVPPCHPRVFAMPGAAASCAVDGSR